VRAYVRRNKTDAADAAALIEALRCAQIHPVPVKSVEQQLIQQLHRMRSQWMGTRTARINLLRATLREFGLLIPLGATRGLAALQALIETPDGGLPDLLRPLLSQVLSAVRALEQYVASLERQLRELTREDPIVQHLMSIPRHRAAHRHGTARRHRRYPALPLGPPSRQLARSDRAGVLLRRTTPPRAHQQTR